MDWWNGVRAQGTLITFDMMASSLELQSLEMYTYRRYLTFGCSSLSVYHCTDDVLRCMLCMQRLNERRHCQSNSLVPERLNVIDLLHSLRSQHKRMLFLHANAIFDADAHTAEVDWVGFCVGDVEAGLNSDTLPRL